MKIYFLVGQSGTGKDTIKARLFSLIPSLKDYTYCTTRPMRDGEVEGREYFFKTQEEYESDLASGVVIESRVYNFNGDTPVVYYSLAVENNEDSYIVIGTPDMCHSYIKYYGADIVKPIFICVSDRERLMRTIKREDNNKGNYKEVARRFYDEFNEYTEENISSLSGVEYVSNDNLDDCVEDIRCIIEGLKRDYE